MIIGCVHLIESVYVVVLQSCVCVWRDVSGCLVWDCQYEGIHACGWVRIKAFGSEHACVWMCGCVGGRTAGLYLS
jgi:hypothetical protein